MLTKENIKDIYKVSPMQEGMYYHFLNDPDSSSYLEQFSYRIYGELKIETVEKSLNELLKRHDILRTVFNHEKVGQTLQIVLKERCVDFTFKDLRSFASNDEKEVVVTDLKKNDRFSPFNLNKDVLMRIIIIQFQEYEYEFIWTHHHILLDGWSVGILVSEYNEIYRSYIAGLSYSLSKVKQYRTYIDWLEKQEKDKLKVYWRNYLKEYDKIAEIPQLRSSFDKSYRNEKHSFKIDEERSKALKALAAKNKVTLNTLLQAIWGVVLSRYNDCRDVVYGTVVSGRPSDLENSVSMVGLFINTIPVRVKYEEGQSFLQLLQSVQKEAAESEPHHYFPLAEIQAESNLKYQLINHLLVFENYPIADQLEKITEGANDKTGTNSGYGISNLDIFEQTNYDFNIIISAESQIVFQLNYNANIFPASYIYQIAGHIKNVINQISFDINLLVDELKIITNEEIVTILEKFNNTEKPFPSESTLHELFENQVLKRPNSIAIECGDDVLSYKELNERANQLAHCLKEKYQIEIGDLVGLLMDRSELMIIGILGILKTGAAYLPVDPDYPAERARYMVEDADLTVVLVDSNKKISSGLINSDKTTLLNINDILSEDYPIEKPKLDHKSNNLAYVIYTSGSTGNPKGVMIEHRGVVNRIDWMWHHYNFNETDVIFQKTPYVFDVSVWEFFMTLCYGARLVICPKEVVYDPDRIAGYIQKHQITTLHFVPSMFNQFLDSIGQSATKLKSLRRIITSGESLLPETVNKHYKSFEIPLHNLYGPTEASVDVSSYETKIGDSIVPIGKPISNIRLFILDRNNDLCPIGVIGEICIAGIGLARGYLNKSALTLEKFKENPFEKEEKIYFTGDLGRWLPDGEIEFLGRRDNQVKIRGNRIELGEVENVLLKMQAIEDAAVIAKEEVGTKYLVAYLKTQEEYGINELREYLSHHLPDFMIPATFVLLREFPVTASGKVDRKALSVTLDSRLKREYIAPQNELEEKLVKIWEQILECNPIGVTDNFFEFGGHSLKAIKMSSFINKELKVRVSIKEIFTSGNILNLAHVISSALKKEDYKELPVFEEQEFYPLSHGQKGLYLKYKFKKEKTSFNMFKIIEGKDLNTEAFDKAAIALMDRHESLRTSFIDVNNEVKQKINKTESLECIVEYLPFPDQEIDIKAKISGYINMPFDLNKGPLLRIKVFCSREGKYLVLLIIDHIISDAWSISILEMDLLKLYHGYLNTGKNILMPLVVQFKDYSVWQKKYFLTADSKTDFKYWKEKLSGTFPSIYLPGDNSLFHESSLVKTYRGTLEKEFSEYYKELSDEEKNSMYGVIFSARPLKGKSYKFVIDEGLYKQIVALANTTKTSLFEVLASSINLFIYSITSQREITIGTPVSVRDDANVHQLIGWFLDTLILRNTIDDNLSIKKFIEYTAHNTAEALSHRAYPFEKILDELDISFEHIGKVFIHLLNFDTVGRMIKDFTKSHRSIGTPTFDLNFTFSEYKNGIELICDYRAELFSPDAIETLIDSYINLLNEMTLNAERNISSFLKMANSHSLLKALS